MHGCTPAPAEASPPHPPAFLDAPEASTALGSSNEVLCRAAPQPVKVRVAPRAPRLSSSPGRRCGARADVGD